MTANDCGYGNIQFAQRDMRETSELNYELSKNTTNRMNKQSYLPQSFKKYI